MSDWDSIQFLIKQAGTIGHTGAITCRYGTDMDGRPVFIAVGVGDACARLHSLVCRNSAIHDDPTAGKDLHL